MKKAILTLFLTAFLFQAFAQTSSGSWNSITATYTNTEHKITWALPSAVTWTQHSIKSDGTLFKAKNEDTQILVMIYVEKDDRRNTDIWSELSFYRDLNKDGYKDLAKQNGMIFNGTTAEKTSLCGFHAIKTKTDMSKYYPSAMVTVHSVFYNYHIKKNGRIYTISATGTSVLETELNSLEKLVNSLFDRFNME